MITDDDRDGWRRPDASMSLLADLFAGKLLDHGYAEAAARRARSNDAPSNDAPKNDPGPRRGRLRGGGVLLVLVLAGTLIAVAGAEVRRGEPVAAERRSRLIDAIHARTAETDALQRRLGGLRADTERRRAVALATSESGRGLRQWLATVSAAAAAAPASGEGLVVTLDDAPHDDTAESGGRVYDQDLQVLVNGLWAAGADAIGINGQRLTPTTAIRAAGQAVLVDYRPLGRPYEVTALGDPDRLRHGFGGSAADLRLQDLNKRYRIRYDTHRSSGATLPAAGAVRLRYAAPIEGGGH